jgi:biopolymer transport protein ExbD
MAELDTSGGDKKGGKVRSKKQSTRVDLTAMVDLAFLLITFFMLTTTLAKPQAMDMFMPDKNDKNEELDVKASRTMTVLLGSDNKIVWYMGVIGDNPPTVDNFGKNGIRKSLVENNKKVIAITGNPAKLLSQQINLFIKTLLIFWTRLRLQMFHLMVSIIKLKKQK